MASDNKQPSPATAATGAAKAQTQDEIEEIMSEIKTLQQGLADAPKIKATLPAKQPLRAVQSPPPTAAAPKAAKPAPAPAPAAKALNAAPPVAEESVDLKMEDFRGTSDDASMEDTLGSMKDEPTGPSLLDSAMTSPDGEVMDSEPGMDTLMATEGETQPEAVESVETPTVPEAADEDEDEKLLQEIVETVHESFGEEEESMSTKNTGMNAGDGCLSMTVTGNMTLKLKYDFNGQEVTIGFDDQALKVQLADGTEFKIPVRSMGKHLKAA